MAFLFKPLKVFYTLGGKRVPRGTPGAKKVREKAKKWYGQGIPGEPPKKRFPLASDKDAARKMLADMVADADRGEAGLSTRAELSRSLDELIDEYREHLARTGTAGHAGTVVMHARAVAEGCKLRTVADLRRRGLAADAERFVWSLTESPHDLSAPTAAYYGKHARSFTRWLWRKRQLLAADPLAGMDLPSQATTAPRRALAADELARLIDGTAANPNAYRGLSGAARSMLYAVAASTGFRVGELAALTEGDFALDGDVPTVALSGTFTKNEKDAVQPLPPTVAARLRAYVAGSAAGVPVWPGTWHERAAMMFRADMVAAGVPVKVGRESATFHSLRHSYTSMLAQYAPVKVTQELARHSTAELTIGRYAHTTMREKADAVARLPVMCGVRPMTFADMGRADLEQAAYVLLRLLLVLSGSIPVAPEVAPRTGILANATARPKTNNAPAATGAKRRKGLDK